MIDNDTSDEIDVEIEEDEPETYVSYDIATYPSDFNIQTLYQQWQEGDIEVPPFQRNYVWSIKQASLLIESFLLGLPVPNLFFYVDENNKGLVVDGQQRLMSICYFLEGLFGEESSTGKRTTFRLIGLSDKSPFFKKTFAELTEADQRKFLTAPLRVLNIRQLSPDGDNSSMFHIFERLNTGGTSLRAQEIRNCVYRGEFTHKLQELNNDPNWRLILGQPKHNKHQNDVELILRVFAFYSRAEHYSKPMKEFLNNSMKIHKNGDTEDVSTFVDSFPQVTMAIIQLLGEKPFHLRGPLNRAAMDVIMSLFMKNFHSIPEDINDRFNALKENEDFVKWTHVSTSDDEIVKKRINLVTTSLFV